ncbi:hypothetical protein HAHE_09870 [Haloferula helveola]|uniref:Uncharacterized protein n=1 Tax=Haloferula helveola TaxID=490095 RepID=A0ABM7R815_9BACT|nr:hypothetical protein HAHE_09870 [Haloferula helveola]
MIFGSGWDLRIEFRRKIGGLRGFRERQADRLARGAGKFAKGERSLRLWSVQLGRVQFRNVFPSRRCFRRWFLNGRDGINRWRLRSGCLGERIGIGSGFRELGKRPLRFLRSRRSAEAFQCACDGILRREGRWFGGWRGSLRGLRSLGGRFSGRLRLVGSETGRNAQLRLRTDDLLCTGGAGASLAGCRRRHFE